MSRVDSILDLGCKDVMKYSSELLINFVFVDDLDFLVPLLMTLIVRN